MLIVLLDEPGLFVFRSAEEAAVSIEPIDARAEIRAAFDEAGVPYRADWSASSRRETSGGLFVADDPGEYQFAATGPADPAGLLALLEAHAGYTDPPEEHAMVLALRERLRREVEQR